MPVDTQRKRFAMLGFGDDIGAVLPVPDGTITALDRATLLALYAFDDADEGAGEFTELGIALAVQHGMKGTKITSRGRL